MVGDEFGGTDFLERKFRMLMDVVPPRGQFLDDGGGAQWVLGASGSTGQDAQR